MGSLPNLHELSKSDRLVVPAPIRLSPNPGGSGGGGGGRVSTGNSGGGGGTRAHHRRLQQTNSLCTGNFYGVMDRLADMQINEKPFSPTSMRSTASTTNRQLATSAAAAASVPAPTGNKRRDSQSSSAGASSVRRLIQVVRSTPSNSGPAYNRRLLCRNYVTLCLGHGAAAAALIPFLALQGSISAWWWPDQLKHVNGSLTTVTTDIGSALLSGMFGMAAVSALFGPTAVSRLGTRTCLIAGYLVAVVFIAVHLYPKVSILLPGYLLMGTWMGCWTASRTAVLMTLSSKIAYVLSDKEECELEGNGRREAVAMNLGRGLQMAHDVGLIVGNAFVAYMIASNMRSDDIVGTMFARGGDGRGTDRTCGSVACPLVNQNKINIGQAGNSSYNQTLFDVRNYMVLPCKTTQLLASVFAGCCFVGVAVTATFMTRIRLFGHSATSDKRKSDITRSFIAIRDAFRNPKLQMIAPLSVFIGLEQGFIYTDFTKFYVVCSVGVSNVPTVLLSLGVLQLVAGFTVSLILQHFKRYHIIMIGCVFHACLLMVLIKWKPSGDDAALLYVIAAAWGVCNAIWDTLSFNFVVSLYPDNWHGPMAHAYFFQYGGMALAFGLHGAVCNATKLYCMSGALAVAVALYGWLEWRLRLTRRRRLAAPANRS